MKKSNYVFPIIAVLIALTFSINKSSIWIDEMLTYQVMHGKSFSEMLSSVWNSHNANGGMPLYFVFEWMWTQLFGYTEIGLRSLNIPFAIIYLIVSWYMICKIKAPSWFCVLFFFNPLFIYYMNEARPYIMLLCIGSIYTYLLFYRNLNDYKTLFWLHFTFLIGLLTHMMFGFIILMYLVECIRLIRLRKLDFKKHLSVLGGFAIPYIVILYHYMKVMTGAGEIGGVGGLTANWKASIIQIVYYFAGFGGLGLSRNDLRSMILSQLSWIHITCILLMVFGYLTLFLYVVKNKLWKDKHLVAIFLPGFIAFGGFCIINILFHTRFWERHIIYLLPVLLILLCYILKSMFFSKKMIYRGGAVLIVSLTALSGMRTMFDKYYEKEDYKSVSAYIKNQKEDSIFLLQGDSLIYNYYGIDFKDSQFRMINNANVDDLNKISQEEGVPLVLVLSSRKEFDSGGLYYKLSGKDKYNSFRIVEEYNSLK
ncbi:MAG: hypothetical protein LIO93_05465 [Bacteroidales bacterium]|nr:hypothetical protein [Bacteroidales bacterium]